MKKLLQRLGILRTPDMRSATYEFCVFLMSEGEAQGIPRPLEVRKFWKRFTWDAYDAPCAGEIYADDIVNRIIRYGLDQDMANGKSVRYTPRTIYKITKEVSANE
jgi:hypothetical protein